MSVRVRIAPAPSGSLHVGNVRTFLFNWLYARANSGTMVLRIEDTDPQRFTQLALVTVLEDLRWMGLDWDEGPGVGGPHEPYLQSERIQLHRDAALNLLESGNAYRCYCTPDELKQRREEAQKARRKPIYDRRCLQLSDSERSANEAAGKPSAVRFRVPEGSTTFDDLAGKITVEHSEIEDFVLLRSDGSPLYQLGVVVDDGAMEITHVIRGDDHLSNTPKQILLHQALGNPVPNYVHLPQVLGADGKPLAKRHGAVSVGEFREAGYLPEAMFNYLALLGWGTAEQTIFSSDQLIEQFKLDDVHPSPARFDQKKLDWMNGEHIRALPLDDFKLRLKAELVRSGLMDDPATAEQSTRLEQSIEPLQTRMRTLSEGVEWARPLFDDVEPDPAEVAKTKDGYVVGLLEGAMNSLGSLDSWDLPSIEQALRASAEVTGVKLGKAFKPLYVAISGRSQGAPLFDSMFIIGKQESLRRLKRALTLYD